eukprot:m.237902 g.237902  ORF g.237902 m.237902 type:complete len:60 (+) comp15800_c2_seq1:296-475(+)
MESKNTMSHQEELSVKTNLCTTFRQLNFEVTSAGRQLRRPCRIAAGDQSASSRLRQSQS